MEKSSSRASTFDLIHRRIEKYTPDRAVARLPVAAILGYVAGWTIVLGIGAIWDIQAGLFWGVLGLIVVPLLGIPGMVMALLTLWPVYLSLIGKLDKAKHYSVGPEPSTDDASSFDTKPTLHDVDEEAEEDIDELREQIKANHEADTGIEEIKEQYAAGEISEESLERQIQEQLDSDPSDGGSNSVETDPMLERDGNPSP